MDAGGVPEILRPVAAVWVALPGRLASRSALGLHSAPHRRPDARSFVVATVRVMR